MKKIPACLLLFMLAPLHAQQPFKQVLKMQGIVFNVESPNTDPGNTLWIVPTGLTESESAIKLPVPGVVRQAQVADLNKDGSPEVYVSVQRLNGRNVLMAYAANRKKSLSEICLPPVEDVPGYLADDVFTVTAAGLKREFQTTNGLRHIVYALKAGGNGWLLEPKVAAAAPARPEAGVPELRARDTGELEVLMPKGGVLLYSKTGKLLQKGGTVSKAELEQANKAVLSCLNEQ